VLAAGPPAASACNQPYISVTTASAEPGDVVYWSIGNADLGAAYDGLRIAGREVVPPGTVTEPKPHGSFVMPDFGDRPISVSVETVVSHDHEGGPWHRSATIQYRPPVAPPQSPATPIQPSEPVQALDPAEPERKHEPQGSRPAPGPPTDPPRGHDPASGGPGRTPSDPAVERQEPVQSAVPLRAAPVAEDRSAVVAKPRQLEAREPGALPGARPVRAVPLVPATRRALPSPDREEPTPAIIVAGLSCLLVCAVAGTGWWLLRRRGFSAGPAIETPALPRSPPSAAAVTADDLRLEAELQELIAEERARHMDRETAAIRTGPG
jgi:hypothetical protein